MATSLTVDECRFSADANDMFAAQQGLLVLRQSQQQYCMTMSFTIPSGCYALVTRHGSDLDYMDEDGHTHALWPAGLHFPYPPWVRVSHFITKQSTVFHCIVVNCRTKDDITVDIKVVITFRIMGDPELGEDTNLVRKFVYELTPSGLERQFRDTIGEIVRDSVGSMNHTEVYGIRSGIQQEGSENVVDSTDEDEDVLGSMSLTQTQTRMNVARIGSRAGIMVDALNARFNHQGVEILSVIIKNVLLPEKVLSQMTDETICISAKTELLDLQDDIERKHSMQDEINTMMKRSSENKLLEDQAILSRINRQQVQLNDDMSRLQKSATEVREESRISIQKAFARNEYEIQQINDKTASAAAAVEMKAKSYIAEQIAEVKKINESYFAEASLHSAKIEAEVGMVLAEAEGKTATWKTKRRDFITNLKKIEVYDKLASNEDLILNSSSDENIDFLAVADRIIEQSSGETNECSLTSAAAEIGLLKQVQSKGVADIILKQGSGGTDECSLTSVQPKGVADRMLEQSIGETDESSPTSVTAEIASLKQVQSKGDKTTRSLEETGYI